MGISPASMNDPSSYFAEILQSDDDSSEDPLADLANAGALQDASLGSTPQLSSLSFAGAQQGAYASASGSRSTGSSVGGLAGIENRLGGVIEALAKEFSALQHTLASALQSLFGGSPATARAAHAGGNAPSSISPAAPFAAEVQRAATIYRIDPTIINAVIQQESGGITTAVSPAGAIGLMQLMPQTARELGVQNPFDPVQNIDGGAKLLGSLLDRYGGRLDLALAAYNAGPAAVDRYGGIPPYPETQAYVRDIMAAYREAAFANRS